MKPRASRAIIKRVIGYPVALGMAVLALYLVSIRMPGRSYDGPLPPLTAAAESTSRILRAHVVMLAARIGERDATHHRRLDSAATYIEAELRALGYDVTERPYTIPAGTYRSIEATLPGAGGTPEMVLVGAHYDTVIDTPGADDNASGVACLLELARILHDRKPARSIRFVAFPNEEPPLFWTEDMGSLRYAREARARNDSIIAMFSLETLGFYRDEPKSQRYPAFLGWFYPSRGNYVGFVGNVGSRWLVHRAIAAFRAHTQFPSEGSAAPQQIPGIGWSDQWSFWKVGYPAIMITDTAPNRNDNYHTELDRIDTLDYDRMARVVFGVADVILDLASRGK